MDGVVFYVGAVLLVLLMAWRGWRLGIVRQLFSIVALALGYAAGILLGKFLIPVLRPIGFPDRVLVVIGGVIVGFIVYVTLAILAGVLFKRTSQQSVGLVKWGFGLSGALLGAGFGLFLVLVCVIGIRLIGSVTKVEPHHRHGAPPMRLSNGITAMKHALEQGATGAIIEKIDPIPGKVYDTIGKIGLLASNPDHIDRFAGDRDVRRVSAHPKILALRDDPDVQRAIRDGDYFALLRNPKVVDAANDPDVLKLLGTFDLQKALDHSLHPPQKPSAR